MIVTSKLIENLTFMLEKLSFLGLFTFFVSTFYEGRTADFLFSVGGRYNALCYKFVLGGNQNI